MVWWLDLCGIERRRAARLYNARVQTSHRLVMGQIRYEREIQTLEINIKDELLRVTAAVQQGHRSLGKLLLQEVHQQRARLKQLAGYYEQLAALRRTLSDQADTRQLTTVLQHANKTLGQQQLSPIIVAQVLDRLTECHEQQEEIVALFQPDDNVTENSELEDELDALSALPWPEIPVTLPVVRVAIATAV